MPGQAIVSINDKQWAVALATTPMELSQGLEGVTSLPAGTGMLFVLGAEAIIPVTTAAMLFPIDLVWTSQALTVVELAQNVAPGWLTTPQAAASYLLEVNAGETAGIAVGDPVAIQVLSTGVAPLQEQVGDVVASLISLLMLFAVFGMMAQVVGAAVAPPREELLPPGAEYPLPLLKTERVRRPTREDVQVEVWEERDRLHIGIQDRESGEYIASWWDDEARHMFEEGFFRASLPRRLSARDRTLVESVLDYAEGVGLLAAAPSPHTLLPRTRATAAALPRKAVEVTRVRPEEVVRIYLAGFPGEYAADSYFVPTDDPAGAKRVIVEKAGIAAGRVRELPAMPRLPHTRPFPPDSCGHCPLEPGSCGHCPLHKAPAEPGQRASPRLIGPREKRQPPEELEFFADSAEPCCASVDGTRLRPQLEQAFREAIGRARAGGVVRTWGRGRWQR